MKTFLQLIYSPAKGLELDATRGPLQPSRRRFRPALPRLSPAAELRGHVVTPQLRRAPPNAVRSGERRRRADRGPRSSRPPLLPPEGKRRVRNGANGSLPCSPLPAYGAELPAPAAQRAAERGARRRGRDGGGAAVRLKLRAPHLRGACGGRRRCRVAVVLSAVCRLSVGSSEEAGDRRYS